MPVDYLAAIFEVVLDDVEKAVLVYDLEIWVIRVVGWFADAVFLYDFVDGEVVEASFGGEGFAMCGFAYARGTGNYYVRVFAGYVGHGGCSGGVEGVFGEVVEETEGFGDVHVGSRL